jgi:RHH-type transcriptional regulator, rel operon repressor / antitoxin RelB
LTISLRLNEEDTMLIKKYAELNGMSVSELVRQSVLDRIEDEYDLKTYEKAMAAFRANPVTYTLDEIEQELGLQ